VTGEANYTVNIHYFLKAITQIKMISLIPLAEVQPLSTEEYAQLHEAGVYSI
jgi:2-iminoacetate synthase